MTLGKPMANGYPISAVVTRKSIVAKYAQCHGEQVLAEVNRLQTDNNFSIMCLQLELPLAFKPFI